MGDLVIKFGFPVAMAVSLLTSAMAIAQDTSMPDENVGVEAPLRLELGGNDYQNNCASCHGVNGHGDGPVAEFLALVPIDLTALARKNHGVFPSARVAKIIDGRQQVRAHGSRDMPVWGIWFNAEADEPGLQASEREALVRKRIESLVAFLKTIQVK